MGLDRLQEAVRGKEDLEWMWKERGVVFRADIGGWHMRIPEHGGTSRLVVGVADDHRRIAAEEEKGWGKVEEVEEFDSLGDDEIELWTAVCP